MVKLILTWNIKDGRDQAYFSYVLEEYLPRLNQLGFDSMEAWITVYGDRPQIMLSALMGSWTLAGQALRTERWQRMNEKLLDYVEDLDFKLVPNSGGFQF
jgi:hypothetical protein